jgi:hypothetical protein
MTAWGSRALVIRGSSSMAARGEARLQARLLARWPSHRLSIVHVRVHCPARHHRRGASAMSMRAMANRSGPHLGAISCNAGRDWLPGEEQHGRRRVSSCVKAFARIRRYSSWSRDWRTLVRLIANANRCVPGRRTRVCERLRAGAGSARHSASAQWRPCKRTRTKYLHTTC